MSKSAFEKLESTLLNQFVSIRDDLWKLRQEANAKDEYSRQLALDHIISRIRNIEENKHIKAIIRAETEKAKAGK